jgi:hypothetical protein
MPNPTGYTPDYSFSGFQASNPTRPLPANSLDAELAAIAAAVAETIAALVDIRREDGALQNGEVTNDSLAPGLQEAINGGSESGGVLASELDPSAYANQAQAEGGVATDRIMTPLGTKQAMDAQRAFASQAEAQAATAADVVLSPATAVDLLGTKRKFATQAEAEAVTDNTVVLSPLSGKQLLDKFVKILNTSQALTWAEIAAGASATQTVTVTGAQAGDAAIVGLPAAGLEVGLRLTAWTSAVHTVSVRLENTSASPIDPANATWKIRVFRF